MFVHSESRLICEKGADSVHLVNTGSCDALTTSSAPAAVKACMSFVVPRAPEQRDPPHGSATSGAAVLVAVGVRWCTPSVMAVGAEHDVPTVLTKLGKHILSKACITLMLCDHKMSRVTVVGGI